MFAGAWTLYEAGIGYSNKEKVKDKGVFIETRSVGGWYLQFLKGYAGIGVLLTKLISPDNNKTTSSIFIDNKRSG